MFDHFSRFVWARLCNSKMPLTTAQFLNNHVLRFFEEHATNAQPVFSGNDHDYCGWPEEHPYDRSLRREDIEPQTTKVGGRQSNSLIKRFPRTLLEEHFRIKGQTTWYEDLVEMEKDLDVYYNTRRPHHNSGMEGRTHCEVFKPGSPTKTSAWNRKRPTKKVRSQPRNP